MPAHISTRILTYCQQGPLSEIFDHKQLLTDVSGSGNNWAHGHNFYGPKYHEFVTEKVRATVEECDSLQSFFLVHSLGGGTGSGLGSYIMEVLQVFFIWPSIVYAV